MRLEREHSKVSQDKHNCWGTECLFWELLPVVPCTEEALLVLFSTNIRCSALRCYFDNFWCSIDTSHVVVVCLHFGLILSYLYIWFTLTLKSLCVSMLLKWMRMCFNLSGDSNWLVFVLFASSLLLIFALLELKRSFSAWAWDVEKPL